MSNSYHFAMNTSYAGCLAKHLYEDIFSIRAIKLIKLQKIGEKVRLQNLSFMFLQDLRIAFLFKLHYGALQLY